MILTGINTMLLTAFACTFPRYRSFVPAYIGILPLVLFNYIYVRELVAPPATLRNPLAASTRPQAKAALIALGYSIVVSVITIPPLFRTYVSLGWTPASCLVFSFVMCIAMLCAYIGVKVAVKKAKLS
ncbi:hypothetical protein D1Y84_14670 [Acidipila sp. EB88]|nr:hypothetical protein D1Y84_14670 [Acidipila sp. EB88]